MTCTSSSHVRLLLAFLIAAVGVLAAQPTHPPSLGLALGLEQ